MRRAGQRRLAMGMIVASLAGCQLVVPTDEPQCKTDADCDGRGGAFVKTVCVDALCLPPGDKCLGHVPPIVEDPSAVLHTRLHFVGVNDKPIDGIEVFVCAGRDETCESPVGPAVTTRDGGYAYMTIWRNFRGTFQVKNPPAGSDLMKTKVHAFPALEIDEKDTVIVPAAVSVHLVTRTFFAGRVEARTPLDPNAGHILASTVDCAYAPRAGVTVSLTSDVKGKPPLQFYFTETRSASFADTETAREGAFGFANVPEGPVVVESSIPSLGRKAARVELWVNKDTISTFAIAPTAIAPSR